MKKHYSSYEEEDAYRKGYYGRYRDYEYEEYSDRARDRAYFDGIKEQEQERKQRELMERQEQEEMIHQRYVEEERQREREQEEQIQEEQQY